MEEAPNKRNAVPSLTNDTVIEILRHLPTHSLFRCKCVCRSWNRLIKDNYKLMPRTVAGFYDGYFDQRSFINISGIYPLLSFLPFTMNNVAVSNCCNSLMLCWCLGDDGYRYVVCNPVTEEWKVLRPRIHSVGEARLGFDPIASSHFHVFEYMVENWQCMGVNIYSSKSTTWIFKEYKWGEKTRLGFSKRGTMFLNGCLHSIGYCDGYPHIHAMDIERKIWRKIPNWSCAVGVPFPMSSLQNQGHLCQCIVGGHNMSELSVWILEDYGTNDKWTLKHTLSLNFDYLDPLSRCRVAIVHPEWNLIFFIGAIGLATHVIAYNMDNRKFHCIPTHFGQYVTRDILPTMSDRPSNLLYAPLFSKLES